MVHYMLMGEGAAATGMDSIVTKLNTGISSSTLFGTVESLMPWVITLVIACLGLFFLRKLIKGASKGKVKF